MFDNYRYVIISTNHIPYINFNEVMENSYETLRFSINGLKTFVKWSHSNTPPFLENIPSYDGPYTWSEMNLILLGPEWESPEEV